MPPGTEVRCPTCRVPFRSVAQYTSHYKGVHGHVQAGVLCPKCPPQTAKCWRTTLLKKHMQTVHRNNSDEGVLRCKNCNAYYSSRDMVTHIRMHAVRDLKFTCPYAGCHKVFMSSSVAHFEKYCIFKLNRHRTAFHGQEQPLEFVDVNETLVHDFDAYDDGGSDGGGDGGGDNGGSDGGSDEEVEDAKSKYRNDFWAIWMKCEFCDLLPETILTDIISKLTQLVLQSSQRLRARLRTDMPGQATLIDSAFDEDDWITECFLHPNLASPHCRKRQAESLATVLRNQVDNTFPVLKSATKSDIHRVNVKNIIIAALEALNWKPSQNDGFPEEMDYARKLLRSGEAITAGYKGSVRYREVEATVPPNERPGIHLLIYADELDRDKMGSSSGRNKIHLTYVKILNLTDGLCRTSDDYHLLQIAPSETLKVNEYQHVMRPVIENIAEVVRNGVRYKGKKYGVRLATLQGDGLERAAMFGMASNFSTLHYCDPLSYLTRKTRLECQSVDAILDEVSQVRTRERYDQDVLEVHTREHVIQQYRAEGKKREADMELKAKYEYSKGMKFESPFHTVPHFHVTDKGAVVFCIAHDLYSGAFRKDMGRVLVSLCDGGHFTWKALQDHFRGYRLGLKYEDRQGWYDVICNKQAFTQLPGNHASNHLVIRFFGSLFINRSPDDPIFKTIAWALYLCMKEICELVSCKVVSQSIVDRLDDRVKEYLRVRNAWQQEAHSKH